MSKRITIAAVILHLCINALGQNWDIDWLKSINPPNPSSGYWRTTSGSIYWGPELIAAGVLTYGLIKQDKAAGTNSLELVTSALLSYGLSSGIKYIVRRQRPEYAYPGEIAVTSPTARNNYSFPSGHVAVAFADATTLTLITRKWAVAIPAYLWASTVGYSRMYLGKHYPSDVLGGIATGVGGAFLNRFLTRKLFQKRQYTKQEPAAVGINR